jgi:hypothetical protein
MDLDIPCPDHTTLSRRIRTGSFPDAWSPGSGDREIDRFVGDGIYDREPVYEAVQQHSSDATMVVPPRKDAVLSNGSIGVLTQRNQHISKIERMGRSEWRRQSGYYLQSHVENTFLSLQEDHRRTTDIQAWWSSGTGGFGWLYNFE